MKNHWMHVLGLFALIGLALPTLPEDEKEGAPPEEDSILGTWYLQTMEGEVMEEPMRLVFQDNNILKIYEGDEEEESGGYRHNQRESTITIYEQDNPADVEAVIQYSFIDDMLVFLISEGPGEDDQERFELTRKPEGTKRHQQARKEMGSGKPGANTARKSMTQLRGLHQGAVTFSASAKDTMPASIGDLVVGDYVTPEYVIPPWSETEVPEGFDDWEDQNKRDWANKNTGYVYLRSKKKLTLDHELLAFFELPASTDQKNIYLLFDDNHSESRPFAEADKLIKKQTGHSIVQWMKTTSPGTGEMKLPEKEGEADE